MRLCILPDDRGLILGKDKNNTLKRGVVYELRKILDEVIIIEIGPMALRDPLKGEKAASYSTATTYSDINRIAYSGEHIVTEEEMIAIIAKREKVRSEQ